MRAGLWRRGEPGEPGPNRQRRLHKAIGVAAALAAAGLTGVLRRRTEPTPPEVGPLAPGRVLDPEAQARAERRIAAAFGATTLAALGLAVVYILGGQPQAEGALLGTALGGLGYGLVEWARSLTPEGQEAGEYAEWAPTAAERAALSAAVGRGERVLAGRRLLMGALGAAAGALGLAMLFPIRSLGPGPGRALFSTAWRAGRRLVTDEGVPVRVGDLDVGGILTVFPERHTKAEDAQTVLLRVEPGLSADAPGGLLAYSKICTHAGCPVGLYRAATHELLCPCHQSVFDVLDGARPVFGPATRPLPRLPIEVDGDGFVVAAGDFAEPVGPAFWNRDRP